MSLFFLNSPPDGMVVETSPDDSCDRDCLPSFNPLLDGMVVETTISQYFVIAKSVFQPTSRRNGC